MTKEVKFDSVAYDDYLYWKKSNPKIALRLETLIMEILREPFTGIGKPEPLKHNWQGYWSRRITDEHRLVYKVTSDSIIIASCKFHYK